MEIFIYLQTDRIPFHDMTRRLSSDMGSSNNRVGHPESQIVSGIGITCPESYDPVRRRVTFVGFGAQI